MKWQIIMLSALVFVFMSFSTVWANEEPLGESNSQISTSSVASITPLMKGSSGGSKSSSSSSKTKTHDGDDITADNNSTSDDSSGFPWWIIIIIVVIILGIIGLLIWYLFLR